jgi:MFS family permease
MTQPAAGRSPLLILFFVVFLDLLGFGIVIPILPYYVKAYGADARALGLLLAIYSAMQLVFAPVWGRLSDERGRRPILVWRPRSRGSSWAGPSPGSAAATSRPPPPTSRT